MKKIIETAINDKDAKNGEKKEFFGSKQGRLLAKRNNTRKPKIVCVFGAVLGQPVGQMLMKH